MNWKKTAMVTLSISLMVIAILSNPMITQEIKNKWINRLQDNLFNNIEV